MTTRVAAPQDSARRSLRALSRKEQAQHTPSPPLSTEDTLSEVLSLVDVG